MVAGLADGSGKSGPGLLSPRSPQRTRRLHPCPAPSPPPDPDRPSSEPSPRDKGFGIAGGLGKNTPVTTALANMRSRITDTVLKGTTSAPSGRYGSRARTDDETRKDILDDALADYARMTRRGGGGAKLD